MVDTPPPALVTGASRGLGMGFAEALAAGGWHVVAVARTQGALEELDDRIQEAGGRATLAPMDVTDDGAMQALCRGIHDRWGALPLWVHAAVQAPPLCPADQVPERDFARAVATNVSALVRLMRYVAPLLRASGGGTALMLDDPLAGKFAGAYAATKAAQRALIESWRAEATTPRAPRVLLLAPRPCRTATRARFFPGEDRARLADPRDEARRLLREAGLTAAPAPPPRG